jgi:hypothetical protein
MHRREGEPLLQKNFFAVLRGSDNFSNWKCLLGVFLASGRVSPRETQQRPTHLLLAEAARNKILITPIGLIFHSSGSPSPPPSIIHITPKLPKTSSRTSSSSSLSSLFFFSSETKFSDRQQICPKRRRRKNELWILNE